MLLTEAEKKRLRGLGHALQPLVRVGSAGVTPGVIAELDRALHDHELVKVRVSVPTRGERERAIAALVASSGAALIARVGHVALLFRPPADGSVQPAGQ